MCVARFARTNGVVLESGYPRNDVLSGTGSSKRAERTRGLLGLVPGERVVLYAPTFRDEGSMVRLLDLERIVEAFPDTRVLVRGHANTIRHGRDIDADGVLDVTTFPDITDLYLVADVCITDYSSVMFDFTITGKPILFFVPDLAEYRDTMRGTYFDLGEVSPGPMLTDTADVIAALQDLPGVRTAFAERYATWVARFN